MDNNIDYETFIDLVKSYNPNEVDIISKAYDFASFYHDGQKRESGEDYITHPLNVAYILAQMHADRSTICAALLHDILEDTKATKEEIEELFGSEVLKLVDGVTNIKDLNFSTSEELYYANTRKIITGITSDVRIIIIKLADRLHNMRTLKYKKENKQIEKSLETMDIYVPFAYYIGAYRIKTELEDLAFKYLKPYDYNIINEERINYKQKHKDLIIDVGKNIRSLLMNEQIPSAIRVRTKNIYGIYKDKNEGKRLNDIHDLFVIKLVVDSIRECYLSLGCVHSLYKPLNEEFKDYICNPKTNMYRSLHTTIYADNRLVQTQIRTPDMDKIASFGLPAFWDIYKGNARNEMQKDLNEKYQFFDSLVEINSIFSNNKEFVNSVKNEVFSEKVHVFTSSGLVIELPKGATIVDYAYKLGIEVANRTTGAVVNGEDVPLNYVLNNRDRVILITCDMEIGPEPIWEEYAQTSYAKKMIKSYK